MPTDQGHLQQAHRFAHGRDGHEAYTKTTTRATRKTKSAALAIRTRTLANRSYRSRRRPLPSLHRYHVLSGHSRSTIDSMIERLYAVEEREWKREGLPRRSPSH